MGLSRFSSGVTLLVLLVGTAHASWEASTEHQCEDGVDGDNDSQIDAADSDCQGTGRAGPDPLVPYADMTCTQSSIYNGNGANYYHLYDCNDNPGPMTLTPDADMNHGGCGMTNSELGWFQFDLGGTRTVTSVVLTNTNAIGAQDRLQNLDIKVGTQLCQNTGLIPSMLGCCGCDTCCPGCGPSGFECPTDASHNEQRCTNHPTDVCDQFSASCDNSATYTCDPPLTGSFVKLEATSANYLHVCGIEVYAHAVESCSDGTKNQDETGVDCGGATCTACPTGCFDYGDGRECVRYIPFGPNDEYHMECTVHINNGDSALENDSECKLVMSPAPAPVQYNATDTYNATAR